MLVMMTMLTMRSNWQFSSNSPDVAKIVVALPPSLIPYRSISERNKCSACHTISLSFSTVHITQYCVRLKTNLAHLLELSQAAEADFEVEATRACVLRVAAGDAGAGAGRKDVVEVNHLLHCVVNLQ